MVALRKWLQPLAQRDRVTQSAERDIDIRLRPIDQADGSCAVSISGPDDRRAEGRFRSPFAADEIDRALAWMDEGRSDSDDARAFGERLFRALFQGAVAGIYVASQDSAAPARVRLTVDAPDLARIPWELLVDPSSGGALALRGRFVRGIATEGGARPLAVEPPLRLLIADSSPRDQVALGSQLEARDVETALRPVVAQGRIEVVVLQHATLSALLNALREGATANPPRPFHVVHWIGHGIIDAATSASVLLFENADGGSDPVDGARLADVLHGSDVRLVLLNACHSAAPTPMQNPVTAAETTRGIAEVLLTSGIPAVVGMRVSVLDETARRLAHEFYEALADGRAIDGAVLDARRLVVGRSPGDAAEIGVPIVYLRSGTGELLKSVTPLSWWQRPLLRFRRLAPIAKVAVFVILALATLAIERSAEAVWQAVQGPARMTGEYNVVVTEFDSRDEAGRPVRSQVASDLSQNLAETLQEDLRGVESANIEVRAPGEAGRLSGTSAEERALAARRLADRIGADVVVYGWLDASRTTLQPEFYIKERVLTDAQELVGSFRLGSAITGAAPIDEEAAARINVRKTLVSRARAISELVLGLSFFRTLRYPEAERHFDVALAAEGWPDDDGKEILYLFRGSTAGMQGELAEAAYWFDKALVLNPGFARGRLGLAEVEFQKAKGNCERDGVKAEGLREAREAYRDTLSATDQPASANVTAKAHLGIARVDLCISQAEVDDRWGEAWAEAGIVVAAFEAGDDSLRQLAAEAHGVRAISELPAAAASDAEARFQAAEREYRQAIALGSRQDRLAAYGAGLAYVLGRLGRLDEARREYDEAIRLAPESARPAYQRARDQLDDPDDGARPSALRSLPDRIARLMTLPGLGS
jgi:tetratricopeptide (TPR) repeat protein